ncbi:unnamed protein product [Rotaria sp. Silwood2]|nr:unnamed protein product [Rotaria sp. Silwood2]
MQLTIRLVNSVNHLGLTSICHSSLFSNYSVDSSSVTVVCIFATISSSTEKIQFFIFILYFSTDINRKIREEIISDVLNLYNSNPTEESFRDNTLNAQFEDPL